MADDAVIKYSDLIGKDDTFIVLSKQIEILKKELLDLAAVTKKEIKLTNPNDAAQIEAVQKKVTELKVAKENLNKIEKVAIVTKKAQIQQTAEELIQLEAEKLARREAIAIAKNQAIILKAEKDSIEALRAKLALTTIEWKKLTIAEQNTTNAGKALAATKKDLTAQLEKVEKATGDARRGVGKYEKALGFLEKTAVRIFVGRTIFDGIRKLGSFFGGLIERGKEYNSTLNGLSNSFANVSSGFQFIGTKILEFLAPAITFVSDALSKIPAIFGGVISAGKQFGTNLAASFDILGLKIQKVFQQINKSNPFSKQTTAEINRNIALINAQITAAGSRQISLGEAYNKGYAETLAAQKEFEDSQSKQENAAKELEQSEARRAKQIEAQNKLIEQQKTLLTEINTTQTERIKAIESLQAELSNLEAGAIKDRQEAAFALEQLRFDAEQKQQKASFDLQVLEIKTQQQKLIQLFGKDSKEVADFKANSLTELNELEFLNEAISEQQIRKSEERKLAIRKEFAISTIEIEALTQESIEAREKAKADAFNKSVGIDVEELKRNQEEINAFEAKQREDRIAKTKEANKQIVDDVAASAQKVAEILNGIFAKQAELSAENVTKQEDNLARARERAEQGLTANIAFEEAELAKRQAENIKRQKEAANAAKLLSLFSLVSAYAQNGDKNALFRGLADFAILEAIGAALPQFYEGTEDTGTVSNPLDNKGGRRAILHDNERVVPKKLNAFLDGMSNEDLVSNALIGSHVSDNFPTQSITKQNLFEGQKNAFVRGQSSANSDTSTLMLRELSRLNERLSKQPNIGIEIEKVYTNVYDIVKSEVKAGMIKVSKKRL